MTVWTAARPRWTLETRALQLRSGLTLWLRRDGLAVLLYAVVTLPIPVR